MTARDWLTLIGVLATLAGAIYQARRAGRSSDRAQRVAMRVKQEELAMAANSAENSGFTRAQEMLRDAAGVQQAVFDSALERMQRQMVSLQQQLDAQKIQLSEQAKQLHSLERTRDKDRRMYSRYIQKLLDLLHHHQIEYPAPPPFSDDET